MIRRILPTALIAAGLLVAALVPADAAGPPGFAEGVKAYNARQYKQALSYFAMASAKSPADPMVHYYMGLSYQGINQMTLARQEYTYVASCRANPQLAGQASQALSNLSRYSGSYAGSGYSGSAIASRPSGAPSAMAQASSPPPSGGPAPTATVNGRLKVLYFTTDW